MNIEKARKIYKGFGLLIIFALNRICEIQSM